MVITLIKKHYIIVQKGFIVIETCLEEIKFSATILHEGSISGLYSYHAINCNSLLDQAYNINIIISRMIVLIAYKKEHN